MSNDINNSSTKEELTQITFPHLEKEDFQLCRTIDEAKNSKAFKLAVYNILNLELPHINVKTFYDIINTLNTNKKVDVSNEENIDHKELDNLEYFINENYHTIKDSGDYFIENNLIVPETTIKHNLSTNELIESILDDIKNVRKKEYNKV